MRGRQIQKRIAVLEDDGWEVGSGDYKKFVLHGIVPQSVGDARSVLKKVLHAPAGAASFLREGELIVQPRGPATEALGIRYRQGVFQVSAKSKSQV